MERTWVKGVIFSVAGVFMFLFVLWATLPLDEVKDGMERRMQAALGSEYDVEILDLSLSGLTGAELEAITISTKPPPMGTRTEPGEKFKRMTMTVDRVEADFALFRSIFDETTVDFEVEQSGGSIIGTYSQEAYTPLPAPKTKAKARPKRAPRPKPGAKKDEDEEDEDSEDKDEDEDEDEEGDKEVLGHRVQADIENFPLHTIKFIEAKLGLPLTGNITGSLDMLFSARGQMLDGTLDLKVTRVALGPGSIPIETPLGPPQLESAVRFGTLKARLTVEGGKMTINQLETTGPDVLIEANGTMNLAAQFGASTAKINARVKPSAEFLNKTGLSVLLNSNAKIRRAKAGEWYGILLNGSMKEIGKGDAFYPSSRTASGLHKAAPPKKKKK